METPTIAKTDYVKAALSIEEKYKILQLLTRGVCDRNLKGMVIHGDPGIGKTYTIEQVLLEYPKLTVIRRTGAVTPLEIYNQLGDYPTNNHLHLFDDCDDAFKQEKALNLMKGALDTKEPRVISWGSSSSKVRHEEVIFNGVVLIITNTDMSDSPHYRAILDRVHNFNFTLTMPERIVKIQEVAEKSSHPSAQDVAGWMFDNATTLGHNKVSLRTFSKLIDLSTISPQNWKELAHATGF